MPTAFITGITGQDGSYLAELLLQKEYKVVGLISSKYNIGYQNIEHIQDKLILEDGDLLDAQSLERIFESHKPDEVYNLAGITFVPASWEKPTLTLDVNTLGVARMLELIATKHKGTKFFQASSSRMFGDVTSSPQDEHTPFNPQEPYSVSKVAAHQLATVMRDHFDIFVATAIMYNHESERRGPEFVTRKITQAAAKIKYGQADSVELGDLEAKQDWGYAPDYVEAMWLMLQHEIAEDFILASGEYHSVKDICQIAFDRVGLNYQNYVKINPAFVRKENVTYPQGDISKAKQMLNWQPKVSFEAMIQKMVDHDLELLQIQNN